MRLAIVQYIFWSQSYDRQVQRQRFTTPRVAKCILKTIIFSFLNQLVNVFNKGYLPIPYTLVEFDLTTQSPQAEMIPLFRPSHPRATIIFSSILINGLACYNSAVVGSCKFGIRSFQLNRK
jgi:hypothetical protein